MTDEEILEGRILDLAERAWQRDILTHTGFLTLAEQARLQDLREGRRRPGTGAFPPVPMTLIGGFEEAERRMAVFLPSYPAEEEVRDLVRPLKIVPKQKAFAEELTHRDYLGALMNLGIERELLGDILTDKEEKEAVVFAQAHIAEIICADLTRVRHTDVTVRDLQPGEALKGPETEDIAGSVASERLDCLISFVFRLSRTRSQEIIRSEAVTADGRLITDPGRELKEGSRVSVRGLGKFIYRGAIKKTKKDRLIVCCQRFV